MIEPGDNKLIFLQEHHDSGHLRGVLYIDKCDWSPAPLYDNGDKTRTVTPDHTMLWLYQEAIDRVENDILFLFMVSFQHQEGLFIECQ